LRFEDMELPSNMSVFRAQRLRRKPGVSSDTAVE
jgi:hypothetical protein